MPAQALAAVATLLAFAPHGNRIDLALDHGAAGITWLSGSTFHFRRALDGPLPPFKEKATDPVSIKIDDLPGSLRLTSAYLEVTLQKHGLLLRVRRLDGTPLSADLTEPHTAPGGVEWDRAMPPGARFYGLGPAAAPSLDLRGASLNAEVPFLVCSAGYGEFHTGSGAFHFDFTAPDRYRIQAPAVDYYFYFGPTPKEIYKERNTAGPAATAWQLPNPAAPDWSGLHDSLLRLVHAAMSGVLDPRIDLSPYGAAPAGVQQRARQIGSLVPTVSPGSLGLSGLRKQLTSFFAAYAPEVDFHGYPTWHPLPFQFPDDPECARHADEFMLGDEMLVAPIADDTRRRSLYLPQGTWTSLETNEALPGRRMISVETESLPVYARNGSIVPLDSGGGIALHYFPRLGAEFFLLEEDLGEYSQVHAAPAAGIMRLEIESKKDRYYQWVIHHLDKPSAVGFEDATYRQVNAMGQMADRTWLYDASLKNLHVRVLAKAGQDCIINVSFE